MTDTKLSLVAVLSFLLFIAFPAQEAEAQMEFELGPTVGFELSAFESLSVGADSRFDFEEVPVTVNPTFDYYFIGDGMGADVSVSAFSIGANALYDFDMEGDFTPYVGAGLNYTTVSVSGDSGFGTIGFSGSSTGLNLIGGAKFDMDALQPFVQAKFTAAGAGSIGIGGGLLFDL